VKLIMLHTDFEVDFKVERCCILFLLLSFRRVLCEELINFAFIRSPFNNDGSFIDEVLKYQQFQNL